MKYKSARMKLLQLHLLIEFTLHLITENAVIISIDHNFKSNKPSEDY